LPPARWQHACFIPDQSRALAGCAWRVCSLSLQSHAAGPTTIASVGDGLPGLAGGVPVGDRSSNVLCRSPAAGKHRQHRRRDSVPDAWRVSKCAADPRTMLAHERLQRPDRRALRAPFQPRHRVRANHRRARSHRRTGDRLCAGASGSPARRTGSTATSRLALPN
jgi:hypothetical protein